ncbi:hypothetical protein [Planococcus shenhongbingii]|uniref:Uncharacterized protein n=1 Tax=Planococcus shenhongbingii TaxID=3058398 RepID=A0ABT8N9S3_9BACL|nr:hypothetical protein [Planococcus sp. N017]MDN7244636.1 hypothetical protein [Planococcus sp. N017]
MMKGSRLTRLVYAIFLAIAFGLISQPVSADFEGNPWPGHTVSAISCESTPGNYGYGSVHAFPPSFVRSWGNENELIIWAPTVYRLVGNKWVKWSDEMIPAYALATPNGISGGWFNLQTREALTVSSIGVPFGKYTIQNSIYWDSAYLFHDEWAPNSCEVL